MTIQILGLREFPDEFGGVRKAVTLEGRGWRAKDVPTLLANYETLLQDIPESDRYNLFFTLAHVKEGKGRTFLSQEIIPFDIDGIDKERTEEYIDTILPILGITREQCCVLFTGHGLHIYIQTINEFDDTDEFKEKRHLYKALCDRINKAMAEAWLVGDADTDMWSAGRMGRFPNTLNKKPDKPEAMVEVVFNNLEPINFSLEQAAPMVRVDSTEQVSPKALERMPKPDTNGILDGCLFLKYCKNNQTEVKEPQWYAMLSILGRLEDGNNLCHEYSCEHPSYKADETDFKAEQSVLSSGPRTCDNVHNLWGGCEGCAHFGNIKSPILIKSESHIATRDLGFRNVKITKDGVAKAGNPNYDDMLKYFCELHEFINIAETRQTWVFDKSYWTPLEKIHLEAFSEEILDPKPTTNEVREFVSKVQRYNVKPMDFFQTDGMMNLGNGVLDFETMDLIPHSPEYGFRYTIPFDYDKEATCDRFDLFMKEITCNDQELIDLLLEYLGYCLSGVPAWKAEKAMILLGEGSNGKSVLLDVIRYLAGKNAYSSISMADINKEQQRHQLVGKLFNVSEETPRKALVDSSMFKNLITGGEMTVKKLYSQPYSTPNHCKFMFACNDLPDATDKTTGLFRRLLIVPFNASFKGAAIDRQIRQKLQAEASGILNRVIEGYKRLEGANWHFTEANKAIEQAEEYTDEVNELGEWIRSNIKIDTTSDGSFSSDLYNEYKLSMELAGVHPSKIESHVEFSRRLGPELGISSIAKYKTRRRKGGISVSYLNQIVMNRGEGMEESPQDF